jgi:hypothetical protein
MKPHDGASRRPGREVLAAALADPPSHTSWQVTRGERFEVRDGSGQPFAYVNLAASSIKDTDGRLLVTLVPAVMQMFSLTNQLGSALSGMLSAENTPWHGGGGATEAPPLNLRYVPAGLSFARIHADPAGPARVELLPSGRLNDRSVVSKLAPELASRIRGRGPLRYRRGDGGVDELGDPQGRLLARLLTADTDRESDVLRSVEVLDNDLPGVWLLGILIGCRRWHR